MPRRETSSCRLSAVAPQERGWIPPRTVLRTAHPTRPAALRGSCPRRKDVGLSADPTDGHVTGQSESPSDSGSAGSPTAVPPTDDVSNEFAFEGTVPI